MGIIGLLIGAFIAYWIIRTAVFAGMRDFEKWKRKQNADRYDQYDQYDQRAYGLRAEAACPPHARTRREPQTSSPDTH